MKFLIRSTQAMAALLFVTVMGIVAGTKNIPATLIPREDTTILVSVLGQAGLVDALAADGPFTVFAPTDHAFRKLPPGILEFLAKPENVEVLRSILLYHVVGGAAVASDAILSGAVTEATTLKGEVIDIDVEHGRVILNDVVNVIEVDILATNGIIHIIDQVLIPPSLVPAVQANLLNVEEIVDFEHQLDALFQTVVAAGLAGALADPAGTFTLLAPNNNAFEVLTNVLNNNGIVPTVADLQSILTYHVIPSAILFSDDIPDGATVTTLNGEQLTFRVSPNGIISVIGEGSSAVVVRADLAASNGVVHIIDTVLLPFTIGSPPSPFPPSGSPPSSPGKGKGKGGKRM